MGFNCFKATKPLKGDSLSFTTEPSRVPGTHLSRPWSHKVVLNPGPMGWKSSALRILHDDWERKKRLFFIIMSRMHFTVNLYSIVCLNVNELLARNRHDIWSLIDSNRIRTHNHLVRKWTLNHLAKLAKWLSFEQGVPWHSGNYIV